MNRPQAVADVAELRGISIGTSNLCEYSEVCELNPKGLA